MQNKCPYPWTSLYLNYDGEISPCCFHYPIANIRDDVSDLWNSKALVKLRERWVVGNLKGTPCAKCPGLLSNKELKYPIRHEPKAKYGYNQKLNYKEYMNNNILLKSQPVEVLYVPSTLCNYNCIHCCQLPYDKTEKTRVPFQLLEKFYNLFGRWAVRHMFSGGEPLMLKETYQILNLMSDEQKESSELVLLTNASLVDKVWDKLEGFNCYQFEISIASILSEEYKKIHGTDRYDDLLKSLKFINQKRETHDIRLIRIVALMKSNINDVMYLRETELAFNLDETWILPVHASDGKLDLLIRENIFALPILLTGSDRVLIKCAIEEAKELNMQPTLNHLEYAYSLLPKNETLALLISLKNILLWYPRVAVLKLSQSPSIRRFIKKIKSRIS